MIVLASQGHSPGNALWNVQPAPTLIAIFRRIGWVSLMIKGAYLISYQVHGNLIFARWLYSLNLAINANFRLKNKAHGIKNDLPLGDGWGHWVPEVPYQQYLSKYGHQIEVRAIPICTSHSC